MEIGYTYLLHQLNTTAFALPLTARTSPVLRIIRPEGRIPGGVIRVPQSVAPSNNASPVEHLVFALKHEGLELSQALLALRKIEGRQVQQTIEQAPNSEYVRRVAYLWEWANPNMPPLQSSVSPTAPYQMLFDPKDHYTARPRRGAKEIKWRVDFNGLGTREYCPTVRRHPALDPLIASDIIGRTKKFTGNLDARDLDRMLRWAYLSETKGSDQIEREPTSHDKARRFAELLSTAGQSKPFSEDALAELQRTALTSPMKHEFGYRAEQNWLVNGARGPLGVTYVPPTPALCTKIMSQLELMANDREDQIHPLIAAALISFGVVLAHPFMDGNGRVHRFIFHAQVCSRADMSRGLILPISAAIGRHEGEYLAALESFSRPARLLWNITRTDEEVQHSEFVGDEIVYRHWDATPCVSFGVKMANAALETDLLSEHQYLARHDVVAREVARVIDMTGADLNSLVREVLTQGSLSKNKYKKLVAQGYQSEMIDEAVRTAFAVIEAEGGDVEATDGIEPT